MKKLEVVLALDNTGSMEARQDGRVEEGVETLLEVLKKAEKKAKGKDDIKVAIVPFDYTVNVGTSAKDAVLASLASGCREKVVAGMRRRSRCAVRRHRTRPRLRSTR